MNIFVTHYHPFQCALEHNDVHLRKMIVETAQMLSTVHVVLDNHQICYRKTHQNHPCNIWLREDSRNYCWTWHLLNELCKEYVYRFNKTHKTSKHVDTLNKIPQNLKTETYVTELFPTSEYIASYFNEYSFVCGMDSEFKTENVCKAYHDFLNHKFQEWKTRWQYDKKSKQFKFKPIKVEWTKRQQPHWYNHENIK